MILKKVKDTQKHAISIAKKIRTPSLILLSGELGAGKTEWVRSFVRSYLKDNKIIVSSPSYSIVNVYKTKTKTVVHMDLYRLSEQADLESIGLRDYLSDPKNIICIEWSGLITENHENRDTYKLEFKLINESQRELSCTLKRRQAKTSTN